jgi:tetratricopeptide (TPR) repeat protein
MYHRGDDIRAALKERRRLKPATEAAALEIARDVDRQIEFAVFALSVHEPFVGMVDLSRADPQQKERYFKLWESYSGRNAIRYSLLDPELAGRCTDVQLQALTKTVQSSSGSAVSYAYLGTLQQRKGDLDGAIESFNRSLVLGADVEVHSKLAFALLRRSTIDDAIRHYEEALQLRPFHKKALANLGRAWLQQGEFEKAVDSLQEALRWEPGLADAHSNLGAAYAQMKYYGKAIPHFEEALRLKPELWRVRRNLELAQQRLAEEGVAP